MKPSKTFKLAKTSKRMMASICDDVARHEFKNAMIQAQLASAVVPKKEKSDK